MNFNEVMDINARTKPKSGKREIEEISHKRSANGGHVFMHRMINRGGDYHEPEMHTFGAEEGMEALSHFAEHSGLSEHMVKPDKDSAAGAAT